MTVCPGKSPCFSDRMDLDFRQEGLLFSLSAGIMAPLWNLKIFNYFSTGGFAMARSRRHRMGDRKDGRLIRSLPGFAKFIPYIMPQRNDRLIHYEESFEMTELDRFLRKLRVEGYKGIGILHFLIAAHIRTISMMPGLNRFVVGRRIYARDNIEIVMTVKRSLSVESTETTIKVVFDPTDTILDVYRKMNEKIDEIKSSEENNSTEDFADAVARLPRFLLRFAITLLRIGDYFGWLPQSLVDVSPFHGTMIITDLGSLRIGPVYHHIYNFGTLPTFISFGAKRHAYELNRHGQMVDNKYIDCKFVMDEGIVDGHYWAQALQAYPRGRGYRLTCRGQSLTSAASLSVSLSGRSPLLMLSSPGAGFCRARHFFLDRARKSYYNTA